MTKTPRTEAVAQSVSTDSEHSDLTAYTIMYAHARTLEADNERLREDAERYRWLREPRDEQQPIVTIARQDSWGNWKDDPLWEDELDTAIDRARQALGES